MTTPRALLIFQGEAKPSQATSSTAALLAEF